MLKFREKVAAGTFVQRAGTPASSLTGLNVASSFVGNPTIRGIVTMNSGTTVVSVAVTGIVSGDIIIAMPLAYPDARTWPQSFIGVAVGSLTTGAFQILAVGSRPPISNMPIGWFKVS